MQQQTGFIIDDNEAFTDWQKVFSEDINFSDSEDDFSSENIALLEQKAISRDSKMGISPLNREETCPKKGTFYCTEIRPEQSCKDISYKMPNFTEKEAVSSSGKITSSSNQQISKSFSSENCYVSHLICKRVEMFPDNRAFPRFGNKLLKSSKECSCASFLENGLVMNQENKKQGSFCTSNQDILKVQCESASEMSISSQSSSNSQAMASQLSSTEEMAVSSQESIAKHSSEMMNISQGKEEMAVSSQETLARSSIDEKMNISQEKENPKANILEEGNLGKLDDRKIKVGQCSFLTTSLRETFLKNTSHILHLGNTDKIEFFKNATSLKKSCRRYGKTLKNSRYSNIIRRELRVAKRETVVRIRQKLLAMKEANLLRREKILEAKEKKFRTYEKSI